MNPLSILSGDPDTFVREVWGRRILVHHVEPGLLEGIFGIDQADHLITENALRTPQLRLAKSGSVLPEARFTKHATIAGKPLTGLVDARKVLDEFADGATIVFQGLSATGNRCASSSEGSKSSWGTPARQTPT